MGDNPYIGQYTTTTKGDTVSKKTISVRVATAKVIKALEKAAEKREKQLADHKKATEDHKKAQAEWQKKVVEAIKSGKIKVGDVSHHQRWNDKPTATFQVELPANLPYPEEPKGNYWSLESELEELTNAIALLKMTDEEFVSTNTYAGVARYIS